MKMSITINGITRNYAYNALTDYNTIIQDFIEDVEQYNQEKAHDCMLDQLVNA